MRTAAPLVLATTSSLGSKVMRRVAITAVRLRFATAIAISVTTVVTAWAARNGCPGGKPRAAFANYARRCRSHDNAVFFCAAAGEGVGTFFCGGECLGDDKNLHRRKKESRPRPVSKLLTRHIVAVIAP